MESFRNPKFVERYEDVSFDLETPLITQVANGAHQIKNNYRFVADNSGEVAPFDCIVHDLRQTLSLNYWLMVVT